MKRALGFALAFLLLTSGAAACSDDKDDTATDTTEAASEDTASDDTAADEGDGGDSSGNAEVAAYCEAVEEYVAKAKEVMADPASADASTLAAEGQELTDQATELATADLSTEDAKDLADCTQEAASALTGN